MGELRTPATAHQVVANWATDDWATDDWATDDWATIDAVWAVLHEGRPLTDPKLSLALDRDPSADALVARLANLHAARAFCLDNVRQIEAGYGAAPDPEVHAAVAHRIALLYLAAGDPRAALRVAAEPGPAVSEHLAAALGCARAVAAGRLGDPDGALDLLDQIDRTYGPGLADVQASGPERDRWHTEMGPANIVAHRIAVLADAGRFDEAFAHLADPRLANLSRERRRRIVTDLHDTAP